MTFALNAVRSTRLVFSTLLLLLSFGAVSSRSLAKPAPINPATIGQEVPNPQDECKKAIVDYDKAIKIDPENSEALTSRGICLAILGDDQGAIVDLTEALKFNTTVQYRLRAKSYMALKDYKKALADFDAHIQQLNASATKITDPESRKFSLPIVWDYVERGQAYQALGNSKAAIVDFDQALTFKTDDYYYERGYVYNQRALAKQSLGQKQAALQDFKKAAEEYGSGEEYEQIMKSVKELR